MTIKNKLFSIFKWTHGKLFGRNLGAIPFLRLLKRATFKLLKPRGIVPVSVFGGRLFIDSTDDAGGVDLLLHGVYSPFETEIIKRIVKPGMMAADIGAHIGYFTLLLAKLVGPEGRVHAFEPEPANFKLLSRNVEENKLANVTLYNLALSDQEGTHELYLDASNLGNPSFSERNLPPGAKKGSVSVRTGKLDNVIKTFDFIKIDVQGAEGLALAGAAGTLKGVKAIVMEFWPYGLRNQGTNPLQLLEYLMSFGFSLYVMSEAKKELKKKSPAELLNVSRNRPGGKGWADVLCYKGALR
ncbi:MAG: Methyltransferase FkbM family [Candidatus Beckwithbacteria bacterium GW2011_GWC2_47_9]|uniref:Methyltransferase FkbM family n=1 Tax=Candidatus Beckwithbacteria bacterium GW2011_GWC2_47_9 TaxID=1618373 RepID=A0A0G1WA44_9BACT|nr:MAG: Methyltransferase FkbM family [Parcubacteria group bacterium GW2011_GWA2_47_21]KKU87208.1 MAG: Methyltransferase FkbM family [Candidatus Beckwithbacteria bacterium GW2011_GWC2_47_9]